MKTKTLLVIGLMAVVAGVVALKVGNHQPATTNQIVAKTEAPPTVEVITSDPLANPPVATTPDPAQTESLPPKDITPPPPKAEAKSQNVSPAAQAPSATTGASKKPAPQDPLARFALARVGFDPDAELYWVDAINDPTLPSEERKDLIEDLNEDGLSDPKHPTVDDLPLILNRLAMIEELAPQSMDSVNAEAFMEAYKDLVNLAKLVGGAGEPVK